MKQVSITKTTVWHYIRKIKVPAKYIKVLQTKQASSVYLSQLEWTHARDKAKKIINALSRKEKFIIAACLYWAEGNKKEFCLTNTDHNLIRCFMSCLKEFGV